MSSTFKVPLTKITAIKPHPNADRLEIAQVYDFHVVIQKDKYKVNDVVIYIPIDSVLPPQVESILFPEGSKITLTKGRVKQTKIRSFYSQGMIADPSLFPEHNQFNDYGYSQEMDCAELLGIVKYEPPAPAYQGTPGEKKERNRPLENPHFRKFNGITNIKWCPYDMVDEEIVIQEKIHGSHIRFGKAPFVANTLLKKIKKFFGITPKYEFVYGSNNVELTNKKGYSGFYGSDIYGSVLKSYSAESKIKDGEFVHGEVYGPGIQDNYDYGATEHKLIIFDVRVMNEDGTQRWLNPEEAEAYAKERGFVFVPVLYKGIYHKETIEHLTEGPSALCPKQRVREGVVVKSRYAYNRDQNKRALKSINPKYLEKEQSDYH